MVGLKFRFWVQLCSRSEICATKNAAVKELNQSMAGSKRLSEEQAADALKTLVTTHLIRKAMAAMIRKLSQRALVSTSVQPPPQRHFHLIKMRTGIGIVKYCSTWKRCDSIDCNKLTFAKYHYWHLVVLYLSLLRCKSRWMSGKPWGVGFWFRVACAHLYLVIHVLTSCICYFVCSIHWRPAAIPSYNSQKWLWMTTSGPRKEMSAVLFWIKKIVFFFSFRRLPKSTLGITVSCFVVGKNWAVVHLQALFCVWMDSALLYFYCVFT